jgi:phage terminase large subunit GpA-like protein
VAATTPWVRGIHEALDDPSVVKVVAQKSAQVAWTDGVILNYIGHRIDLDPCPMIVMFDKEGSAKKFNEEKFIPMVEATPTLRDKINVVSKRDRDNKWGFKSFPGGFLKFVSSNSPSEVKSTPAPVVCVEEPDDCNSDVKSQGDTIKLLEERTKSFPRRKIIFGGTPTIAGLSKVETAYRESDKRKFFIPCPQCGEEQVLSWENVVWDSDESQTHETFGHALPDTARYVCPHCGAKWTNAEKNRAVRKGIWRATADFNGVAGFYINELYSPFPGSSLAEITKKYLSAKFKIDQGDDSFMKSFFNNQLGIPYEFTSGLPEVDDLKARCEDYEEKTVPRIGCVLTAGVDVQHDRLAVIIRAWGQGEESWLVYWGEIYGEVMVPGKGAWEDLDKLLTLDFETPNGYRARIRAASIDSSDGQTNDAVYDFVRKRLSRGYMAVKGSSVNDDSKEIFTTPKASVDMNFKQKSSRFGLKPFIVGTSRAKDLILGVDAKAGRIKLTGNGPGRVHWYQSVRPDYFEQITSEVKAPSGRGAKRIWQKKSGVRNEALDCEVYALHAARSLKLHLWSKERWDAERETQMQPMLFDAPEVKKTVEEPPKPDVQSVQEPQYDEPNYMRDDFYDAFNRETSW